MTRTACSLFCLVAIAGCNTAPSAATTRTITSVTWDANHQLVSHSVVVPLLVGLPEPAGSESDMEFNPVDATGCNANDLIISDAPLVVAASGASAIDPASNVLCLAPPPAPSTGDEFVALDRVPYPTGGNWGGKTRAFNSSLYFGQFVTYTSSEAVSCSGGFHAAEIANASACDATATTLEFNIQTNAPSLCTPGSANCSSDTLNVCDPYGEWQAQSCSSSGLSCSTSTLSCCELPVCPAGKLGDACGVISNSCGSTSSACSCAAPNACYDGRCLHFRLPPDVGGR